MVSIGRLEEKCSGDVDGSSMLTWGCCCELAAFFKEMIIRVTIIGTRLSRSKSISHASVNVRAEIISHCGSSVDERQVSENLF